MSQVQHSNSAIDGQGMRSAGDRVAGPPPPWLPERPGPKGWPLSLAPPDRGGRTPPPRGRPVGRRRGKAARRQKKVRGGHRVPAEGRQNWHPSDGGKKRLPPEGTNNAPYRARGHGKAVPAFSWNLPPVGANPRKPRDGLTMPTRTVESCHAFARRLCPLPRPEEPRKSRREQISLTRTRTKKTNDTKTNSSNRQGLDATSRPQAGRPRDNLAVPRTKKRRPIRRRPPRTRRRTGIESPDGLHS